MNKKVDGEVLSSVVARLLEGSMTVATAAVILGVTERQVYKIKKAAKEGKPNIKPAAARKSPPNKTDQATSDRIIALYSSKYKGFSFAHFHEKLLGEEGVEVNFKTMTRILSKAGFVSPFAQKKTKKAARVAASKGGGEIAEKGVAESRAVFDDREIHNRHKHVADFGRLIQMDARTDYYAGDEKWTLHLAMDVASGVFVGAFFDVQETLWGYQNVLHQIALGFGLPKCILADNRTVFEYIRRDSDAESRNTLIQFRYSCIQLQIKLQTTSVATYKAMIERGNGTFGRRLPQEMRIRGIRTIDEANRYLSDFVASMNAKFSRPYPGCNVFRAPPDVATLNNAIGNVTRRIFDKAACIRYEKEFYIATGGGKMVAFCKGTKCLVVKTFDGRRIIVVDSVAYEATNIKDFDGSESKECNPEGERFLSEHKMSSSEFVDYRQRHLTAWSYGSFEKYVENELRQIENRFH